MNSALSRYARSELAAGLHGLTPENFRIFRLMYGNGKSKDASIEDVVSGMPDGKLDWAMRQVHSTLLKAGLPGMDGLREDD